MRNMVDDLIKAFEDTLEAEVVIINQLDSLQHLLEEMTEVTVNFVHWLIRYCDEHKIPFYNEQQLISYIKVSRQLNKEFDNSVSDLKNFIESRKLPLNKFHRRSPEDLPEPDWAYFKSMGLLLRYF